jgi:hypothetical protein
LAHWEKTVVTSDTKAVKSIKKELKTCEGEKNTTLNISGSRVGYLPEVFMALSHVTDVNFSDCALGGLPVGLLFLQNLAVLNIGNNPRIPFDRVKWIFMNGNYPSLKSVTLDGTKWTEAQKTGVIDLVQRINQFHGRSLTVEWASANA